MTPRFEVAVMHDFFIDRLVHTRSLRRLSQSMESKAKSGGGGIHGVRQSEVRGGNAVNLAHALGRLGVRTLLITHSEPAHAGMLLEAFDGLPVEVRVKDASAGLTVAFEERTNVMLGDVAGAGRFGPEMLDVEDWRSLNGCSVVCSANWAANSMGTKLLVALRKKLPAGTKVFLDPADFRDRVPDFNRLLRKIARERLVDWVSMNEQEGASASRTLGDGPMTSRRVCESLAGTLRVRFDLHGIRESYTSDGSETASAKVKVVRARRLTGAGDVWDAGSVYGELRGMKSQRRVEFANAAARLYLQNIDPVGPTAEEAAAAL